jgi:hypothetical protein
MRKDIPNEIDILNGILSDAWEWVQDHNPAKFAKDTALKAIDATTDWISDTTGIGGGGTNFYESADDLHRRIMAPVTNYLKSADEKIDNVFNIRGTGGAMTEEELRREKEAEAIYNEKMVEIQTQAQQARAQQDDIVKKGGLAIAAILAGAVILSVMRKRK